MNPTHRGFSFGRFWCHVSHAPGRSWLFDAAFSGVVHVVWSIRPTRIAFLYWRGKRVYTAKPFANAA